MLVKGGAHLGARLARHGLGAELGDPDLGVEHAGALKELGVGHAGHDRVDAHLRRPLLQLLVGVVVAEAVVDVPARPLLAVPVEADHGEVGGRLRLVDDVPVAQEHAVDSIARPLTTTASTPEAWIASAGR